MSLLGRNNTCWCRSGLKYKKCHAEFDHKLNEFKNKGCIVPTRNMIKNPQQIAGIKESAKINIAVLDYVAEQIQEGITTEQINQWVYQQTTALGAIPAQLHYEGFEVLAY